MVSKGSRGVKHAVGGRIKTIPFPQHTSHTLTHTHACHVHAHTYNRQLRDCYSDLINETFLNCSDIFEEDETGRGVTDADVEEFCKADCPHLIEQVYIDCEFQASAIN